MKLKEVGDDVYACIPDRAASGHSSSGLVNAGGGLVIDTQFDLAQAQRMMALFGRVWRTPPRRIVNTHPHPAHTWGTQLFPNAEILAHRPPSDGVRAERPDDMQRLRDAVDSSHPAVAARALALEDFDFRWIAPKAASMFFEERLELRLDGTEVHLIHVGRCHSQADTVVHLPAERVLFTGDVVCRDLTPPPRKHREDPQRGHRYGSRREGRAHMARRHRRRPRAQHGQPGERPEKDRGAIERQRP